MPITNDKRDIIFLTKPGTYKINKELSKKFIDEESTDIEFKDVKPMEIIDTETTNIYTSDMNKQMKKVSVTPSTIHFHTLLICCQVGSEVK